MSSGSGGAREGWVVRTTVRTGANGPAGATPLPKRHGENASFVAGATALLALFGWLVDRGALPWFRRGEEPLSRSFSDRGRGILGAWLGTLAVFTLLLPLASALAWRRDERVRRAMVPYALALLAQIATEAAFSRLFFPNIVAIVGLAYTPYRLRQLWRVRKVLKVSNAPVALGGRVARALASAGLVLWAANLAFLLSGALPRVVRIGRSRAQGDGPMSSTEKALYRLLNPAVRWVLRSPAHGLLGDKVMLLAFTGRKSGERYAVPVGYVLEGEDIVCFTGKGWNNWWKNFEGGAPAVVRLRERELACRAEAVEAEGAVERGLAAFLLKYPSTAKRYGVGLDPEGRPKPEDVAAAARADEAVMIRARADRSGAG